MPRLHSDRSRSYPGRPARQAVQLTLDSILHGNMKDDRAGVSRGHSSSPQVNEGPNPEQGKGPTSSTIATNPSGGANGRRVADKPNSDENLLEQILSRPNMIKAWETGQGQQRRAGRGQHAHRRLYGLCPRSIGRKSVRPFLTGTYQPLPVKTGGNPESNRGHPSPGNSSRA